LEGVGALYWERRDICKRKLWKRAYLSRGDPSGNLKGDCFTGDFERQVEDGSGNGASLSMEANERYCDSAANSNSEYARS